MNYCAILKVLATLLFSALAAALLAGEPASTYTGYTRPGWPNDSQSGDKIIFAADNPEIRDQAIGGTVYFTVLQLSGKSGDSWGSGLEKFNAAFKTGIDFNGGASPVLDTTAKYLYLYQVVNDRKTPAPIQTVSIKLIVDLSEITSWGHFHGAGFATMVKGEKEAAGGQIRPVSFNNIVAAGLGDKIYRSPTEAQAAPNPLQLVWVPTKLGEEAPKAKDDQRILKVVWDALDPALDPNHVMLLAQSDFNQKPCFRAVWNPDSPIKKDVRSTVFGFTSNRPPTYELVRLRGLRKVKGGEIKPAVDSEPKVELVGLFRDDFQGGEVPAGLVGAEGKVPTPKPERQVQEVAGNPGFSPGLGSPPPPLPPMGGGGGPVGGGAFTPPPSASGGGGGSGGGSGGGGSLSGQSQKQNANNNGQTGTQTQTLNFGAGAGTQLGLGPNQNSAGPTQQTATQSGPIILNFSPILTNQQAQGQLQAQFQAQLQAQLQAQINNQHSGHHGVPSQVVPQPAAWLLAALGLPILVLLSRRAGRNEQPAVGN